MKYFTSELYLALQAEDDEAADAADAAWDVAVDAYSARLQAIRGRLPEPVRELLIDEYRLHDANVDHMGQDGDEFVITLRLDWPRGVTLVVICDLESPPLIRADALPDRYRTRHCQWMHEEVDLAPDGRSFTLAFALSNGLEVDLHFHALRVLSIHDLLVDAPALARPA
jgi:hypothetical protein